MKFKSALVTQVSGSIGGMVGSHNKGGMYFRARSIPTNPQTPAQVAARNALTSVVDAWTNLTEVQRSAWAIYAQNVPVTNKLGDSIQLSGQQHYVRTNTARIRAGLVRVDGAPVIFDLGDPGALTAGVATAAAAYTFDVLIGGAPAWAADATAFLIGLTSRHQNPSINFFKGPYQFANTVPGNAVPITNALLTAPFIGALDNKVFVECRVAQPDGRLSGVIRLSAILA